MSLYKNLMAKGGPAFPVSGLTDLHGLSARDYIAVRAMEAICIAASRGTISDHDAAWFAMLAHKSYLLADAMLKERDK